MSTSRTLVRGAMMVGAVAVVAALWLRRSPEAEPPADESGASAEAPAEDPEPFDEPAPTPAPRPRAVEAAPAAPAAQPAPQPAEPQGPEPLEPQIREHAILMMTPLAKEAMEQGQLDQLKLIQKEVRERPTEGLMKQNDIEALNIAIGCMENGPDAREDATDFIEYGQTSSFGDSLKKACFGGESAPR